MCGLVQEADVRRANRHGRLAPHRAQRPNGSAAEQRSELLPSHGLPQGRGEDVLFECPARRAADQQKRQTPHDAQQPPKPQPPQKTPQPPKKMPQPPQPPQPQPLQPQPRHPTPMPMAPHPRKPPQPRKPPHPPPPQPWHPPQPQPRATCVKPAVPLSLSKRWNVARLTSAISSSPRTK